MQKVSSFLLFINVILHWHGSGYAIPTTITATATNNATLNSLNTSKGNGTAAIPRIPIPRVKLNKCCQNGEYLDVTTQNCIAGSTNDWIPLIYLMAARRYYTPEGRAPNFISFQPNVRPIRDEAQHVAAINTTTIATTLDPNNNNITAMPMPATTVAAAQRSRTTNDGCTREELEIFTGQRNFVLFSNGSLYLRQLELVIDRKEYCVDKDVALVCLPKTMQRDLKLHKCCGKYNSFDTVINSCTSTMTNPMGKLHLHGLNENIYQTLYGFPKCTTAMATYAIAGDWSASQLNETTGDLMMDTKHFNTNEYCIEHLTNGNETTMKVKIFTCLHHFVPIDSSLNGTNTNKAGIAANNSINGDDLQEGILYAAIIVSIIFLAATLITSYLMPSVHHVLHWRCQIYYVFCLFIGKILFAIQLSGKLEWGSVTCLIIASTTHFFFLSAFFWLNTMCFNIWWTFRDFRPSSLERNQELIRLRLYSAYAWGIPLLICIIATLIDQLPDKDLLRPGFGKRNCWFSGEDLSIFAYFFGPIAILLCANIVLFISTTHQLTCGLWKREDVKTTTEKTALGKVCLKLVVVMGVTWIADIISWLIGGPHSIWFLTDLINALQGVFIFIVVGCQPQVWAACKRYCCPKSRQEITNTTNGVQHSSSSQGLPSLAACGAEITQNTTINTTTLASGNGIGVGVGGGVSELHKNDDNDEDGDGGSGGSGAGNILKDGGYNPNATTITNDGGTATNCSQTKIPMETVC